MNKEGAIHVQVMKRNKQVLRFSWIGVWAELVSLIPSYVWSILGWVGVLVDTRAGVGAGAEPGNIFSKQILDAHFQ